MQETAKLESIDKTEVRKLDPAALWNNFADLNAIPRASKKEARVIKFIQDFGTKLGLKVHTDEVGNVIIKKPASKGMENRTTVTLQSHLDMVHQKNSSTNFNFDSQGIEMLVEGDWVKANGTTLGADNGIGVASIMTLLASTDIPHPPLEALFSIDEETGMTGALGLKGGLLDAKIMLNLDTEDDRELTIGCAGGVDVTATGTYSENASLAGSTGIRIHVKGLTGGHSGMDIHNLRPLQLDQHAVDGKTFRHLWPPLNLHIGCGSDCFRLPDCRSFASKHICNFIVWACPARLRSRRYFSSSKCCDRRYIPA